MTIKTTISYKEYAKLLFGLAYKSPLMIVLVCLAAINASWMLCYHLDLLELPKPSMFQYFGLFLIAVVQPLGILFMIWRTYATSGHLKSELELDFNKEEIKMKAEGFSLEIFWSKIYKIVESKNWFVIYQNNLSAIIIPKKAFEQEELEDFRNILRTIKEVPVSLK